MSEMTLQTLLAGVANNTIVPTSAQVRCKVRSIN